MKKSKHKRSSLEALLAVQTAPVRKYDAPQGRESLKSFTAEYERQQATEEQARKDEAERPIRKAEAQLSETLHKLRDQQVVALFQGESPELLSRCTQVDDAQFAGKDAASITAAIRDACNTFRLKLEESGVRLNPSAMEKFRVICEHHRNIDLTSVTNWERIFEYADSLAVWSDHDVTRRQVAAQPQPAREVLVNPLDALEVLPNNREGARAARELANEHYWRTEAAPLWSEWVRSLENHFAYVLPESVARQVCDEFQQRNWSYLDRRNYDRVRVSFVRRGLMPISCLTRDEALAEALENTTVPLDNHDARQDFVRRAQALKLQQ